MRSSVFTLVQVQEFICIDFSTGCKRTRSIVTPIRLYLFIRVGNRDRPQQETSWGKMQSELKPSELIVDFASVGPKYYEYRLITNEWEKFVCKFRGITLSYHASKLVNFEFTRSMNLEQEKPTVNLHTEHKIKRNRRAGGAVDIVTEPESKRYRYSFFKRRRMHYHSSVPLSYI